MDLKIGEIVLKKQDGPDERIKSDAYSSLQWKFFSDRNTHKPQYIQNMNKAIRTGVMLLKLLRYILLHRYFTLIKSEFQSPEIKLPIYLDINT